jgi:Domain of unknown function (DUF1883)/TIR domain
MEHLVYDLKQQKKDAVAVVSLDKQANVRLMTMPNYRSFKAGRRAQTYGGLAKKSPARLPIPRSGHWVVVVDLGGLAGRVRAGVVVEPPPPGLLPPLREHNPVRDVQVREPVEPADDVLGGQTWDVFLSHAGEDKAAVALPLRRALAARGITVWLDTNEMKVGQSLRRRIDQGISASRFGVVVLSKPFFAKGWTNHELDGLITRTLAGEQSLLPIWHGVSDLDVRRYSASLADKVALSTDEMGIEEIADRIADVVLGVRDGTPA